MEILNENWDKLNLTKVYNHFNKNKKNSWHVEFPHPSDATKAGNLYFILNNQFKKGTATVETIFKTIETLSKTHPDIINDQTIKECIEEKKFDPGDEEFNDFEEFWFQINRDVTLSENILQINKDIKESTLKKFISKFGDPVKDNNSINNWIRGINTGGHRTVNFELNTKTVASKYVEQIAELTEILCKFMKIPSNEIIDDKERLLKSSFSNDKEKILKKNRAAEIFDILLKNNIKITLKKEVRDYNLSYQVSMNPVTINQQITVHSYLDIIFGGRPIVSENIELISYKQAKDIHLNKIINEFESQLKNSKKSLNDI